MAVKKIRGINIAYDDLGSGEPIVFIHGHPFNRSMWKYQTVHFAQNYRLILPDLRGYGETDLGGSKVMLDEMALDIAYLLDELNIEKAIFCGLSMGGQILLDFYRLFPERVKAIIIADSDARGENPESYQKRIDLAELISKEGIKKYTDDHILHYLAPVSRDNQEVYHHLYQMMTTTSDEGAAAAHRGRAERRDHLSVLAEIKVKALIIVGSEDYFTPMPIAKLMSDLIPGASISCIPQTGHMPNMEAPELFNAVVEDFLNQVNTRHQE
ncbi:alpha/beta fold hydrolase [Pedobacter cryoconitis]|uniref:Pimeloyl-ACP methyl ester carboxylesterase n=1 Tax=Pedobacter cryoconitis TaxID=188932 RepID=A0A7X0MLE3_9SPHI|nr:alpha/beta hydrolase [Pedobacter cryoconitis]MBB6502996.1 pimeloyl-ACP methyl ester carboxylesterase [Pedobacter cryoconitis]